MTEAEWLFCTDPQRMLRFVIGTAAPRVIDVAEFPDCKGSDRKLRLFACACYHRLRHRLPNPQARNAVAVAEWFADGTVGTAELLRVVDSLRSALDLLEGSWRASRGAERIALHPEHTALALAFQVVRPEAPKAAWYASSNAYLDAAAILHPYLPPSDPALSATRAAEERAQTVLLRDIFGPLLHRPMGFHPDWRTYNGDTVSNLARTIYAEQVFDRAPILADALEDAGCDNAELLGHLRGPGPHVRGCWALDLVLGKE
jgi:hypothetical protein